MEVFKFGGASVKDANGVRNLVSTLHKLDKKEVLIVISAMGKMTNADWKIYYSELWYSWIEYCFTVDTAALAAALRSP